MSAADTKTRQQALERFTNKCRKLGISEASIRHLISIVTNAMGDSYSRAMNGALICTVVETTKKYRIQVDWVHGGYEVSLSQRLFEFTARQRNER